MRLTKEEKQTIRDYWKTDLNIEIVRSRYTAILESDVWYDHKPDGSYTRHKGDHRGLYVWIDGDDYQQHQIIHPEETSENFGSPPEAIQYLSEHGDLRNLVESYVKGY